MDNHQMKEIKLGIGTWQWGDRIYWGYGNEYRDDDLKQAFQSSLDNGLTFFDTAEVYGMGRSETLLGEYLLSVDTPVQIASKFMPFPWRLNRNSLLSALRKTLKRLKLDSIDLYQIHFPFPPVNIETWMEAMVEAFQSGLIRGVGVCNFNRDQLERAHDVLVQRGVRLASIQNEFSLLNWSPETINLLNTCQQMDISYFAYSPLAQGILTGKYHPSSIPKGIRGRRYNLKFIQKTQKLINAMIIIGADHGGKNAAQVALNWVIMKGAIPIAGVKNSSQVETNAGALGWQLTEEQVDTLDRLSSQNP